MLSIDLFSGCGGFSLGAHLAGLSTGLAIDINETLSSSFPRNFPSTEHRNLDLLDVDIKTLCDSLELERPTAVIGGPPCQGFSVMGRREKDDPRNKLLEAFFRHVSALQPKFFVMENVPGLLDSKASTSIDAALSSLTGRYTVLEPMILDAGSFGAATKRKRVIVVGFDNRYVNKLSESAFFGSKTAATVKDAISDLPSPRGTHMADFRKLDREKITSDYARRLAAAPPEGLCDDHSRKMYFENRVSGFLPTTHTEPVRSRFKNTAPGSVEKISRYYRLSWDEACPVLRAGTGSEKGSYQAARPIHPKFNRVITVREAARLQGFPDWFYFHETKWHSHRMIGNSVSPVFAQAILQPLVAASSVSLERAA